MDSEMEVDLNLISEEERKEQERRYSEYERN
jgi:hypothetical protein